METVAKRLYEGMFLVDSAQAAADWEGTLSVINNILQRADAEVVSMRKWQERKLAYDIDHKSRGTYILCYFNASGERIAGIEKDVLLSEKVMRVLVLGTEKRPAEMIEADIKGEEYSAATSESESADKAKAPAEKPSEPAEAPAPPAAATAEAESKPEPEAEAEAEPKPEPEAEPEAEPVTSTETEETEKAAE